MNHLARRVAALVSAAAFLAAPVVGVHAAGASSSSPASITGTFSSRLVGQSTFTETGTSVHVVGRYAQLKPNRNYFTVAYGNSNCDPAQAFPVGPFHTDRKGLASLDVTVTDQSGQIVAGTGSVSVRRGDNQHDLDHDGKLGQGDVVAIAGRPQVGLIECDTSPVHA